MLKNFKKSELEPIFNSINKYLVNRSGQVWERVEKDDLVLMNSEAGIYSFDLSGRTLKLSADMVLCCGFKKVFDSDGFIDTWSVLYMDGNPDNRIIQNMIAIPPKNGQVCHELPECKVIPFTGRFAVSEDGKTVWDRLNKVYYSPNKNNAGYLSISVGGHNGERYKMGLHRAVLWAHAEITPLTLTMIPNHKDGNKENCAKGNLKYSTYSENNKHAIQTKLRDVRNPIEVLDLLNNSVKTFDSMGELAEYLEMNSGYLHDLIKYKPLIPYEDRYVFKPVNAPYEFPSYKPHKLAEWKRRRDKALHDRTCYAVDIFKRERVIAESPYALGKILGLTGDQIKIAFRFDGGKENTRIPRLWPYLNYEFRWLNGRIQRKAHVYSAEELVAFKDKTIITKPLKVTWTNGDVKVYCSLYELSKEITTPSRPVIKEMLDSTAGSYPFDGFTIEYLKY